MEPQADLSLQIAVVGVVGAVLTAMIAAAATVLSNRRTRDRIGDPNGHGSLVAMVAEVLSRQDRHDDEISA